MRKQTLFATIEMSGVSMMESITEQELNERLKSKEELQFVFVTTPLCGTCKLARRMLMILEESAPVFKPLELNVNTAAGFANRWKIKSVPVLLVFKKGLGVERIYAFHSIAHLYEMLKPYVGKESIHNLGEDKKGR